MCLLCLPTKLRWLLLVKYLSFYLVSHYNYGSHIQVLLKKRRLQCWQNGNQITWSLISYVTSLLFNDSVPLLSCFSKSRLNNIFILLLLLCYQMLWRPTILHSGPDVCLLSFFSVLSCIWILVDNSIHQNFHKSEQRHEK